MMKRTLPLLLILTGCATRHVLFDDFTYSKPEEVAQHGWIIRTELGWPGVPGAAWGRESLSIVEDPERAGNVLLRMTSETDGGGEHTRQSQICHQRKYLEGTYAARVRFTDQPAAGPNGDEVVQTFYFISPQKAPMDPDYSEIDFEYLPNGGWNHDGPTIFFTTWETFQLEPWIADNTSTHNPGPLGGWHTLVAQVGNHTVRYFLDGKPVANHGERVYPESMMSINFNLWFVRDHLVAATDPRRWDEDIDWVYFRGGRVQPPQAVEAAVADLRRRAVKFKDTVPTSGLTSPCNF
jgi:hypothetical protein